MPAIDPAPIEAAPAGRTLDVDGVTVRYGSATAVDGVSLATESRLIELFQKHGGDLVRLDVSRAAKAGSGNVFVWRAAAPIVQWRVRKP